MVNVCNFYLILYLTFFINIQTKKRIGPIPGGIQCLRFNSSEWQTVQEYVTMLDKQINAKLLDAGVKYNYGCWNHFAMSEAKMQVVNGKNYWVKLELLCEPLAQHNYAHVYFYVANNIDSLGHVEFPHPQLNAIQYPRSSISSLDSFSEDDIVVNATTY